MKFNLDKKMLLFFAGIVVITFGITNIANHQFVAILAMFIGAYLAIKGLE